MEYIQDVIRGPYPFLIVAQILIIAGLLLSLVWFFFERWKAMAIAESERSTASIADAQADQKKDAQTAVVQEAGGSNGASASTTVPIAIGEPIVSDTLVSSTSPVTAQAGSESVPYASATPANVFAEGAETPVASAPKETPEETRVREEEIKALSEESLMLKDKVKYLESRLMEYEIVQEEISTLSTLRVENEKLKEDILKYQGGVRPSVAETPAPTQAQAQAAPGAAGAQEPTAGPSMADGNIDSILKKLDELSTKP